MINREIYSKDPVQNRLLNNGVATVTDEATSEELRTLRYELETFVCDGEYSKGLERILRTFLDNLYQTEQPGVWVSGFFGSGKSHLIKMLRALWVDFTFPEDQATARGLVKLPTPISDLLRELSNAGRRECRSGFQPLSEHGTEENAAGSGPPPGRVYNGRVYNGVHAVSGTLGAGAGDNVRMTLLGMVFRSVGFSEQYPVARFELWLKEQGFLEAVQSAVEAEGKEWRSELRQFYVSPLIARALLAVYPDFAPNPMEARKLLKEQYPNVQDVTNQQMVDAIRDALSVDGKFPLTLVAMDEVQQYIGENQSRTYAIQEVTETCCKRFGGKLVFAGTGQTALSGTPHLQKLMGRFPVGIELSDTDVDAVIRQVILAKKPSALPDVNQVMQANLGEVSRHLSGTRLGHRSEDLEVLVHDYPILPVRRRFWERTLRAVDQAGSSAQLRNQLKVVHEAARSTAEAPLGTVVPADFIYEQIAPNLLQTGVLSREIDAYIRTLRGGTPAEQLKARACGLIYLIGKLPRDAGTDLGIRANAETLADLMVEDLEAGSVELRKQLPDLLKKLEDDGKVMSVGTEFRLQTRESGEWIDEYRAQTSRVLGDPNRVAQERIDLFRKECNDRLKGIRLVQGRCKEARDIKIHTDPVAPADLGQAVYVWFRDGWDEDQKVVLADARAAGTTSPTIFVYLPRRSADELRKTLASLKAATATLQVRGVPTTAEGEEARLAMQTRKTEADRRLRQLLDEVFAGARVFQGGGQEVVADALANAVKLAAESALIRLYPRFDEADHPGWPKVLERARKGSEAALEAVDYKGAADKHPVTTALIKFVSVGRKGAEIRNCFSAPEFGWSRDAIDGALYALLATGHLRATETGGKVLDAKSLDRAKVTQTHFRLETTTVTTLQRIQIRKLLQGVGVACQPGEELAAMPAFFTHMRALANGAGGNAPRPRTPPMEDLEKLAAMAGNDQLVAVFTQRETLAENAAQWEAVGEAIAQRLPAWELLEALLGHAPRLPGAAPIQEQADAILEQRLLLAEPDPTPGLVEQLTQLLRDALVKARTDFQAEHEKGMDRLRTDANWEKLTPEQKHGLLSKQLLTKIPEVKTGTSKDVLASLRAMSLGTWADRTAALPTRFEKVLLAAAELMEPRAVYMKLEGATFHTEEEIHAWIEDLEHRLVEKLNAADGPLVVH